MGKINNFIKYLISSLDTHTNGASGRKLTAIWIMIIIITPADIYYTFMLKQQPDFINWLIIHFSVVLLLLGLVTVQQILELKNGKTTTTETITKEKEVAKDFETTKTITVEKIIPNNE